jgi:hypothetical protein
MMTAIGSHQFYKNKAKTCRQIIAILGLEHSEEIWRYMCDRTNNELLDTLEAMLDENSLYVEMPS